ncbi:ArsR/SmtB family transcription factor [Streptomyces microflavus]|uniref:ArsR/SmtB family transcription factor n=1 Tax=Streptomyces TaxID=1883 RepID=UPI000B91814C|nr:MULTISPECIES: metalloregulator ArsR/SmtB family transcription factor [Streptomyces]MBK5992656.1 helix-turn-helix transcriptional regulator [Streptomyces sp. MBT58]MBW3363045.1 metalloregulator ArsR/SmtB family transcription factor [Streptomyces sp. 09ZI22]WSR89096.1 metalloregulator ArsR/SmtB family transcription factor [Streptomyces microflavus]
MSKYQPAEQSPLTAVVPCCPPLTGGELSAREAERIAATFEVLANPVRLLLFSRVASHPAGEACVCDIQDVGVTGATVSYHLKKLREAGLLVSERRGTWVFYRLAPSFEAVGLTACVPRTVTGST